MYTSIHTLPHMQGKKHTHTHIHTNAYKYIHGHTHTHTHIRMHINIVYVHTHTDIYTLPPTHTVPLGQGAMISLLSSCLCWLDHAGLKWVCLQSLRCQWLFCPDPPLPPLV